MISLIYIDGSCRNKFCGVGIVMKNGTSLEKFSIPVPCGSSNTAEYYGLIRALEIAISKGIKKVTVRTDSQMIVMQLAGKKNPGKLLQLYKKVVKLSKKFESFSISWIPRTENKTADELAKSASLKAVKRYKIYGQVF